MPVGGGAEQASAEQEPRILEKVVFERVTHADGTPLFKSSAKDRKVIFLEPGAVLPDLLKAYEVEVVSDSHPDNPNKGKLTVRLSGSETVPVKTVNKGLPKPIEVDNRLNQVYVFETVLPLNNEKGKLVPSHKKFEHFTLDQRTMATIEKIATAVDLREPCLLEGETATSKTSAIEYLAMVTGNEVARLNLNGQTDTSELIGKYVPNDGQLQISFEQALKNPEILTAESRAILEKANSEGRGLTMIESQKVAKGEGLKVGDWRWQDGIDIQAKKEGQWLILDEINLAEAQILERLNSQLEKSPSITLTEHGNEVVRELNKEEMEEYKAGKLPGVVPLHPNFRIFATMNPAEYSGRKPMSPAYKNRWLSYKFVESLTVEDHKNMMSLLVYGEQPVVEGPGRQKFGGEKVKALLENLGKIPWFREFVPKMAKFQADIEKAAREREIGKDLKEKYVFTRRDLLGFLEHLASKASVNRSTGEIKNVLNAPKEIILKAIQYYYLDKMRSRDDLAKIKNLLDAIGIGEGKWLLGDRVAEVKKGGGRVFRVGEMVKITKGNKWSGNQGQVVGMIQDAGGNVHGYDIEVPGVGRVSVEPTGLEGLVAEQKAKPKFKVGDSVRERNSGSGQPWYGTVTKVTETAGTFKYEGANLSGAKTDFAEDELAKL
ncbi:MAG: AAA family ATPase [Patescibacteria group bacterium]